MINLISPINQLGYGQAGLNILKSLQQKDSVGLWTMGQPQVTSQEDAQAVQKALLQAQTPDFNAPCLRIWHQHDMSQFVGRGTKIGFPFFELDEFNPTEKHHLNSLDLLFVTCDWAKDICIKNLELSPDQIHVVPLGVDAEIFKPSPVSTQKNTIFFNCGKWEVRKGHDILCDIFNKAFDVTDNVELWLMTQNPFLTKEEDQEWKNLYKRSNLGFKVKFIERVEKHEEVYNIMSKVDCGIFPSRAEGWNLELLELLACGRHVIATNYSAHTQYCSNQNARLVNVTDKEFAYDGKWFHGKIGKWARIEQEQINEFAHHMKEIHNSKQNNLLSANKDGINTAQTYTWDNCAATIRKIVNV